MSYLNCQIIESISEMMVGRVCAPTSNAEEAEVELFYEDLQDLLELTRKMLSFSLYRTGMQK